MGQIQGVPQGYRDALQDTHSYHWHEFSTLAKEDTAPILFFFFKSNKGNYNRINRFFPLLPVIKESIRPQSWLDVSLLYMEMH